MSELAEALESLADLLELSLREESDSGWVTIRGHPVNIGAGESGLSEISFLVRPYGDWQGKIILDNLLKRGYTTAVQGCIKTLKTLAAHDDTDKSVMTGYLLREPLREADASDHSTRNTAIIAALLLAAKKKKLARTLTVAAYRGTTRTGQMIDPAEIAPGDELYLARPHDPAAGTVSLNAVGRLYATALGTLAAGKIGEMATALYEKRWVVDGDPCDVCIENGDAGWIAADDDFPSADEEPPAHPNCRCDIETRRAEEE